MDVSRELSRKQIETMIDHERWLQQFACIGVSSDMDLYRIILFDKDCVELKNETAESGFYGTIPWRKDEDNTPEKFHVFRYKGRYILWREPQRINNKADKLPIENCFYLFYTLRDTKAQQNKMIGGKPCLEVQTEAFLKKFKQKSIFYRIYPSVFGSSYDFGGLGCLGIFYRDSLIVDNFIYKGLESNYYETSILLVKKATQKFEDLADELEKRGAMLNSIERISSASPYDQKLRKSLYEYVVTYKNISIALTAPAMMPSKASWNNDWNLCQPVKFFPKDDLEAFIEKVDAQQKNSEG